MILRVSPATPATPQQLGFLPLIVWAGAAAATAAAGAYAWWQQSSYEDFKANTPAPNPPPAPAAPQTEQQMTVPGTWTNADREQGDTNAWMGWRTTAIPDTPDTAAKTEDNSKLWIAAGAASLALLFVLKK